MGIRYSLTCRNKQCNYHVILRDGEGMVDWLRISRIEDSIEESNSDIPEEIISLYRKGNEFEIENVYLCQNCRKWLSGRALLLRENLCVSPLGTVRKYKLHYIDEPPKCNDCGGELTYILKPRSTNHRCPKCGSTNMMHKFKGCFD